MRKDQINHSLDNSIAQRPLQKLRREWEKYWGMQPHAQIGRVTLEKSLEFKRRELQGEWLNLEQQTRLDNLITSYKRNSKFFDEGLSELRAGIRLVKNYNGEYHSVTVLTDGFEYREKIYGSLSEIATIIAGTRWNGWVFFGLKKRGRKP